MAYEKRLCILKQIKRGFTADGAALSGAVYAERLDGELIITPRLSGIAPVRDGRYAVALWTGGGEYCLELKGNMPLRIPSAPSLQNGFAVLVCFMQSACEPEPIAYGYCGTAPATHERLLGVFGKRKRQMPPMPLSPFEQPIPVNPQSPRAPTPVLPDAGDDEQPQDSAVIEENAPLRDSAVIEENEPLQNAAAYDDEAIAESDYFGDRLEAEEDERDTEHTAETAFRLCRGGLTYYNKVRDRLEAALKKYPRDTRLCAAIPHSEWVKTEKALLGIVYAEGVPRYLCVAAEGECPPPMKDKCVFVPESCFTEEKGFYVVFQDAETGEYVKTQLS